MEEPKKRGRPLGTNNKVKITLRLDADVVEKLKQIVHYNSYLNNYLHKHFKLKKK